jgi:arabinose-5-phosphate isomerase
MLAMINDNTNIKLDNAQMLELAKTSLILTGNAVINLSPCINNIFVEMLKAILECSGRICFCGVGKTGHIARKSAATFCSIGIPSYFLHAAESLHGDLGAVHKNDLVVILSQSGEGNEVKLLLPFLIKQKNKILAISFNEQSYLSKNSNLHILLSMNSDLCPYQLVPTISISLFLSIVDVMAICLMKAKDFTKEEFAMYHPSGNLGRRLLLNVEHVMQKKEHIPLINVNDIFYNALSVIMKKRLGFVIVVDNDLKPLGVIEAKDIENSIIAKKRDINTINIKEFMSNRFIILSSEMLAIEAKEKLQKERINIGIIVEGDQIVGVCNLQDLIELNLD